MTMATKKAAAAEAKKKITVVMTGSFTGLKPGMRENLIGLGLRKPGSKAEIEDTPSVRGMVRKVRHLIRVEGEA
jgi:large subunit ribosomal protein L30